MNDDDIRELFTDAGDGPPLRLEPAQIIREGTRIRRRGKRVAIGASALATGAAVFLISVVVSQGQVGSDREIPAGPGLGVTSTAPSPSVSPSATLTDPSMPAPDSGPPESVPGIGPTPPSAVKQGAPVATR